MTTNTDEYQGWTNRETWCVNLWLTNEQVTYDRARITCREHDTINRAAHALSEYVDTLPLVENAREFTADLINCALARVNWREIATHLRED